MRVASLWITINDRGYSARLNTRLQCAHFTNEVWREFKLGPIVGVKPDKLVRKGLQIVWIQRPGLLVYESAAAVFQPEFVVQSIVRFSYAFPLYELVGENTDHLLILRRKVVGKGYRQHDITRDEELDRETVSLVHIICCGYLARQFAMRPLQKETPFLGDAGIKAK